MGLGQIKHLLRKYKLVFTRNLASSFTQAFTPVLVVSLLCALQLLADSLNGQEQILPPVQSIPEFKNTCNHTVAHERQCSERYMTLVYAPTDVPWVQRVLKQVAEENGLDKATEFIPLPNTSSIDRSQMCLPPKNTSFLLNKLTGSKPDEAFQMPCRLIQDQKIMEEFLHHHPDNQIQNAVLFHSSYVDMPFGQYGYDIPQYTGFSLYFNRSLSVSPSYIQKRHVAAVSDGSLELLRAIQQALFHLENPQMNATAAQMAVQWRHYPQVENRVDGIDVIAKQGAVWFYIPSMIVFMHLLTELVTEKEKKLRLSMRLMGLSDPAFWFSWFIVALGWTLALTFFFLVAGFCFRVEFFVQTDAAVLILTFSLFTLAMASLATCLSTVIASSKQAQTVAYAILLIGFVFQSVLCTGYGMLIDIILSQDTSSLFIIFIRWIMFLYPPFNFSKAYYDISLLSCSVYDYEQGRIIKGKGFTWDDLYSINERTVLYHKQPIHVPPTITSYYLLLMNTILFLLLTWYLDHVVAGDHGRAKRPLFFLSREYWRGLESDCDQDEIEHLALDLESSSRDCDVIQEAEAVANSPEDSNLLVRILDLHLVYNKSTPAFHALRGVSFGIAEGEILSLLGHNGAGKTSLINVLTGLFNPTKGTAYLNHHSIRSELPQARAATGVCPQYDTLWEDLTCEEHLVLFAGLKGLLEPDESNASTVARDALEAVGLAPAKIAELPVSSLSGGMRRRLSLAIAVLGNPRVVFLDEPTTGLDPKSRRQAWQVIQDLKQTRAILLTTHSMEEADCLGDRIAIVVKGELQCIGNSLRLKSRFGSGYKLNFVQPLSSVSIHDLILDSLPDYLARQTQYLYAEHGEIRSYSYTMPREATAYIASIVRLVENASKTGTIQEWNIMTSSLESVFLNVTSAAGFRYDDDHDELLESRKQEVEDLEQTNHTRSSIAQAQGIVRKNCKLIQRARGQYVCQFLTPVVVIGILVVLQWIVKSQIGSDKDYFIPAIPLPLNLPHSESELFKKTSTRNCDEFFDFSVEAHIKPSLIGELRPSGARSYGLLGEVVQSVCRNRSFHVPYFVPRPSVDAMYTKTFNRLNRLNNISLQDLDNVPYPSNLLPDGLIHFIHLNNREGMLNFTFAVNDNQYVKYHRTNDLTRLHSLGRKTMWLNESAALIVPQGRMALMDLILRAFRRQYLQREDEELSMLLGHRKPERNVALDLLDATIAISMPQLEHVNILDMMEMVATLLFPITLTLQLPIYLYLLVMEKEGGLRQMQTSMGMKTLTYWGTSYLVNVGLYMSIVSLFWGAGNFVGLRFFRQTGNLVLFLFFFGWGMALISLSNILSVFVNSRRFGIVVGYSIALFGTLIALVVCDLIFGDISNYSIQSGIPVLWLVIYPLLGLARGVYLMNIACIVDRQCFTSIEHISPEMQHVLLGLYMSACFYFGLAVYLEQMAPTRPQVAPNWLWCQVKKRVAKYQRLESSEGDPFEDEPNPIECSPVYDDDVDDECNRATTRWNSRREGSKVPLVIHELRKEYPAKTAVKKLSLTIDPSECFGLLGHNGAGKTTTISMLTGKLKPTSGSARICGYNIRNQMSSVYECIGVCPQYDLLWNKLTVLEHVEFYARVKGVKSNYLENQVARAVRDVGLWGRRSHLVRELSGGMKRRLSLAIALIGDSEMIFLDEPSTGLDPSTRRQIWTILQRVQKASSSNNRSKRGILLTTHDMEEAELLCARIGIMARGQLRCIGTPVHLKNKFGQGYVLQMNFHADVASPKVSPAIKYVHKICPTARLQSVECRGPNYYGAEFVLPNSEDISMSRIFEEMEKNSKSYAVLEWHIGQMSLDDVFHAVMKQVEEREE